MREFEASQRSDGNLAALAFLYAGGELDEGEAKAFEDRLAEDQSARDALCQAVELNGELAGLAHLAPNPRYRHAVRSRLHHQSQRAYRGQAALWAFAGAAAAIFLTLTFQSWIGGTAPPDRLPAIAATAEPDSQPPVDDADALQRATVWSKLHTGDHVARARDDGQRRRVRNEFRPHAPAEKRLSRLLTPLRMSMN